MYLRALAMIFFAGLDRTGEHILSMPMCERQKRAEGVVTRDQICYSRW